MNKDGRGFDWDGKRPDPTAIADTMGVGTPVVDLIEGVPGDILGGSV